MASFFVSSLTEGFTTPEEIVAWVDDVISAASKAEAWMIDLSTAKDPNEILHYLYRVPGTADESELARLHFDAHRKKFVADSDVRGAVRGIFRLAQMRGLPEHKVSEAYQIDHEADHGFHLPDWDSKLRAMITTFFDSYEERG